MKKIGLMILFVAFAVTVSAQGKYAYVYSQKVFDSMLSYKKAIEDIQSYSKYGKEESEKELKIAQTLFTQYNQFSSSMSTKQANDLKQMIIDQEKKANEFEDKFFGQGGEFERKQKEIMSPVESRVVAAVDKIAKLKGYDMVFDLSLVKVTIFQSPALDITDLVIAEVNK